MRIFVDANVVIDVIQLREPFFSESAEVLSICREQNSALAPHTISNIFFITRHDFPAKERKKILRDILEFMDLVPTGKFQVTQALNNDDIDDFEDALQLECAKEFNATHIVTRDFKDFANSEIPVLSPAEFIKLFKEGVPDNA
jgi:predicted nucleic acid-binding protein